MTHSHIAEELANALGATGRLTVLTGAGISAESGVPTFRDFHGLWKQYRWEDLATPEGFAKHPEAVLEFYNIRRQQLAEVKPNPAHHALVTLQEALSNRLVLITQNVDDLHERAGSTDVLHMHGELRKMRCCACHAVRPCHGDIVLSQRCEGCQQGPLRPHIVWFGEVPFYLDQQIPSALEAEVFLSIGTSGVVYPAAGFVGAAKAAGSLTVTLNLDPADNAGRFDLQLTGKAGELLPRLVDDVLSHLA